VKDARPLSIQLIHTGAFITGRNGVGKSTLLRAVGLNVVVARAFGFCYAESARIPLVPVWASIRNEDSIERGESLYMAEMRRAETLMTVAASRRPVLFIIDEMFRGTNNVEAVSVSAAVKEFLCRGSLVIASSHNAVLAALLKRRMVPMQVVANRDGGLQIEPGVLVHTNGIDMMENYRVPASVVASARAINEWYASYVSTPDRFPEL
jgi:DNA mismatch repair ATPase MutS